NVLGSIAARVAGVPRVVAGIRVADPSRFRQGAERCVAGRWDRAVCVSQSVAAFLKDRLRFPDERIVVIPNGLDLARYPDPAGPVDQAELGVPAGRRLLLTVARLHRQKGIDWLLESLPAVLARVPDCELVLVGRGAAQAELEQQADRLGVRSRVHFLGWRPDVPRLLRSAHLFVLPSRWEGMPNGVLEAMASGLPVVATAAEGVRELLGTDSPLQIVDFGDTPGFVDRICTFMDDPELARRSGDHNRRRVLAHFTLERMVEQYQDLYEELLREC
ncbi:MAG: glycosyltransferase family 4 protein, partial [Pirellulaceae bacterium]